VPSRSHTSAAPKVEELARLLVQHPTSVGTWARATARPPVQGDFPAGRPVGDTRELVFVFVLE
jgi:hypothetical protein